MFCMKQSTKCYVTSLFDSNNCSRSSQNFRATKQQGKFSRKKSPSCSTIYKTQHGKLPYPSQLGLERFMHSWPNAVTQSHIFTDRIDCSNAGVVSKTTHTLLCWALFTLVISSIDGLRSLDLLDAQSLGLPYTICLL